MTRKETVAYLRETIYGKIAPLITGDYVLWGLPYYPNIGDTLIWEGELEFLKRIPHRCVGTCAWDDYSVSPLKKDTVILITGGGYFGDVWRKAWDNVMDTIVHYPENPVILLPNTICYENPETMKADAERLAALKRLVICTRDSVSYAIAKANFSNDVLLVPDMAFCISDRTLDRWRKKASDRTLLLMRTDKELGSIGNPLPGGPGIDIRDWPTMEGGRPRFADKVFGRVHRWRKEARQKGSVFAPAAAWMEKAVAYLLYRPHLTGTGIGFISSYGTIVTTRLHAMISGVLLDRKVSYIDNSYGKLSSFYGTWLSGCEGVERFGEDNAAGK